MILFEYHVRDLLDFEWVPHVRSGSTTLIWVILAPEWLIPRNHLCCDWLARIEPEYREWVSYNWEVVGREGDTIYRTWHVKRGHHTRRAAETYVAERMSHTFGYLFDRTYPDYRDSL